MPRTVKDAKLHTRSDRAKLKIGRQAHWFALEPEQLHLGYRRKKLGRPGTWLARQYHGQARYQVGALGLADDYEDESNDVVTVLDFKAACHAARQWWDARRRRPVKKIMLTDEIAASLPVAAARRRYNVYDTVVPGFSVCVTATGYRSYMVGARWPGIKKSSSSRRLVGKVGTISLADARSIARSWLEQLKQKPAVNIIAEPRIRSTKRKLRFCIYRLYNDHDRLLYIGISEQGISRLKAHCKEKSWANEIFRIEIRDCAQDRPTAKRIEAKAIAVERPLYNIIHNQPSRKVMPEQSSDKIVHFGRSFTPQTTPPLRLLNLDALRSKGISYSIGHLRRLWERGDFPRPGKLSPRKLVWPEPIIDAWLADGGRSGTAERRA